MLKVCSIHVDTVTEIPVSLIKKRMPLRCERALRYIRARDGRLCLGAGILLLAALQCDESELCYGANGKPYIPGKPEFNLSHGGEYAVLAMDDEPVGIDIEPVDEANLSLARTVLCQDELEWMRAAPLARFHLLWTLKESVMKATGLGFAVSPQSFSVLTAASDGAFVYADKRWYSRSAQYGCSALSLCASHPFEMPRVCELRSDDILSLISQRSSL